MKHLVSLLLLIALLTPSRADDVSIYIDNSRNIPGADGSLPSPFNNFYEAYALNISDAMAESNVTVVFVNNPQPYTLDLTYIASSGDNIPYNITFTSTSNNHVSDIASCGNLTSLTLQSSHPNAGFYFASPFIIMAFQNVKLTMNKSSTTPYDEVMNLEATNSLQVSFNNVCFDGGNSTIDNPSASQFIFASTNILDVSFKNVAIDASLNIPAASSPLTSVHTLSLFGLISYSSSFNPQSSLSMENIVVLENVQCATCNRNSNIDFAIVNVQNAPSPNTTNITLNQVASNIQTYFINPKATKTNVQQDKVAKLKIEQ